MWNASLPSRLIHSAVQMGHPNMKTDARSRSLAQLLGALFFAFSFACQGATGEAPHAHEHEEDKHKEGIVQLSPEELAEFGVELASAQSETITRTVELPGEIQPNEDRLAHIVPRFPGIVTAVYKKTGDTVRAGTTLAIVESSESLAPYELKTLTAGTVIEKHITRGEAVTRESQAFVIADLTSVWANLSVYQKDLPEVQVGQFVTISAGHGLPQATGKISYVTPTVDEETRTTTARVVLSNMKKRWRPGMFVTGRVIVERTKVPLAVPVAALQTIADQAVIFVETDEGLQPRAVALGRVDDTHVEIREGLRPDERYVSRGGFTLKAELSREQFGDGHAH